MKWNKRNRIRNLLFLRDGSRCMICKKYLIEELGDLILIEDIAGDDTIEIDHIEPILWGGSDYLENLQLAHLVCNRKKGKEDWGMWVDCCKQLGLHPTHEYKKVLMERFDVIKISFILKSVDGLLIYRNHQFEPILSLKSVG